MKELAKKKKWYNRKRSRRGDLHETTLNNEKQDERNRKYVHTLETVQKRKKYL